MSQLQLRDPYAHYEHELVATGKDDYCRQEKNNR
jgi:hypothetical protein